MISTSWLPKCVPAGCSQIRIKKKTKCAENLYLPFTGRTSFLLLRMFVFWLTLNFSHRSHTWRSMSYKSVLLKNSWCALCTQCFAIWSVCKAFVFDKWVWWDNSTFVYNKYLYFEFLRCTKYMFCFKYYTKSFHSQLQHHQFVTYNANWSSELVILIFKCKKSRFYKLSKFYQTSKCYCSWSYMSICYYKNYILYIKIAPKLEWAGSITQPNSTLIATSGIQTYIRRRDNFIVLQQ